MTGLLHKFGQWLQPAQHSTYTAYAPYKNTLEYRITNNYITDITKLKAMCAKDLFRTCDKYAKSNNTKAIFNLAQLYYYGIGVEKDLEKAFKLYSTIGWQSNNGIILNKIGLMYRLGEGTSVEHKEASECFFTASELNNTSAMKNLGDAYLYGYGFKINLDQAIEWYNKGVKLNSTTSMIALAEIYDGTRNPDKTDKYINYKQAYDLYFRACRPGNERGFINIMKLIMTQKKFQDYEVINYILEDHPLSDEIGKFLADYIYEYFENRFNEDILNVLTKHKDHNYYAKRALEMINKNMLDNNTATNKIIDNVQYSIPDSVEP
jgi:TPR repeat protein